MKARFLNMQCPEGHQENTGMKDKEEQAAELQEWIELDLDQEKEEQMLGLLRKYQETFEASRQTPTTVPWITHAIRSGDTVAYVKP